MSYLTKWSGTRGALEAADDHGSVGSAPGPASFVRWARDWPIPQSSF